MAAAPHIAGVEPLEQQPSDFFTALAGGYIRVMGIAARHQWALQLTHLPTTSGREQRVQAWVR
ncbi:MAG: hypothetical protein OEW30_21850, partial [Acidimicrobiia bacterium]|nr:hypothetical protein [Acidimicrobiia bacterium]